MDPQTGPSAEQLIIGQTIGNYLVTQKLGEGGMGAVYLAEHPTIGKKVALKVLHPEFSTNQEVAARFFNEAKAVNDIGHPNIVDIIDFGIIQAPSRRDQLVYFIMEYLAGLTLSQLIRNESPIPPERALGIALQVADALAASHKCGIIHRDLKPDNIILVQRGRERDFVKLLDYGIAKLTGDAVGSHRTRTGIVMGTPAYMSPEQCEGKGNIDHRTDVYALGIVLYEMLTGRVPFIGEGYGEILVQHLTQRPIAPSQFHMMSPHVEAVVLKALEKRPDMRYPTMDEMMRAMSDPVGYVESHGGVGGFLQRQLMPSNAPLPSIRMTPAPLTPAPGTLQPVPGLSTPVPTTLGASAGEVHRPSGSKLPFIILGSLVVASAAIAIIVVLSSKGGTPTASDDTTASNGSAADSGSAKIATNPGSGSAKTVPPVGSDGSAGSVVTAPKISFVDVRSTPPGAEIFVDGVDTHKVTVENAGEKFDFPRTKKTVTIKLALDKYEPVEKVVDLEASDTNQIFEELKLVKVDTKTGQTGKTGTGQTGHTGHTGHTTTATGQTGQTGQTAQTGKTGTTGATTTNQTGKTGSTTTGQTGKTGTGTTTGQTGKTGTGSGSTTTGKGSGHHDTGLMKPDE